MPQLQAQPVLASVGILSSKIARTVLSLRPALQPAAAQIKVLQWNILADGLAQNGDFIKVCLVCWLRLCSSDLCRQCMPEEVLFLYW